MTSLLKDAPGGPEFIEKCIQAAADLALFFTGLPNEAVIGALEAVRANLTKELSQELNPEAARQIADELVATVLRCRDEMQTAAQGGGSGAVQ